MEIESFRGTFEKAGADVLVAVFTEEDAGRGGSLGSEFDLPQAFKKLNFSGREKSCVSIAGKRSTLVAVGVGKKDGVTREKLRVAYSKGFSEARRTDPSTLGIVLSSLEEDGSEAYEAAYIARITEYKFTEFQSSKPVENVGKTLIISESDISKEVKMGDEVGKATNLTRDMANMPPSRGTPSFFEKKVREIPGLKITVFGREDFLKLGMGGLEGVSRAATEPGKLIIAEYKNSDDAPIMLVGKGITFDSGGISIKPSEGMGEMKFDKCGASAVLGAMKAISDAKLKVHVVGMMPLTENLPGGNAYKPGDILRHYNGKTSEIISTDAEGRLVLSDALSYGVEKFKPKFIVDLATLTGACVIALGNNIAGLMTNDDSMRDRLLAASSKTWERLWPLPLDDDFKEQIRSEVADIKNTGGRAGGAETAGAFLSNFVGDTPWAHLDIAGTAWTQDNTAKKEYLSKGSTGFGTRLLFELVAMESA